MDWYVGKVREPLLEGETITLAGQRFVVAPFNIRRMRQTARARELLRELSQRGPTADSDEAIAAITEIAAVALSANYPDMSAATLDQEELLRVADLSLVLDAARKVNGGGDGGAGEAPAPASGAANELGTGTV